MNGLDSELCAMLSQSILRDIPDMPKHRFSRKYRREMRLLLAPRVNPRKALKYAFVALLLACAGAATACTVTRCIAGLGVFRSERYMGINGYTAQGESPDRILEYYEPAELPEGFALSRVITPEYLLPLSRKCEYTDGKERFTFKQAVKSCYFYGSVTEAVGSVSEGVINGRSALWFYDEKGLCFVLDGGDYIFEIRGGVTAEQAERMLLTLKIREEQ